MRKFKTLTAVIMLAMVMSLGTSQARAGDIQNGVAADGTAESPGYTGPQESPGFTDGSAESPGITGDIQYPGVYGEMSTPGFYGWIGTGFTALASLF